MWKAEIWARQFNNVSTVERGAIDVTYNHSNWGRSLNMTQQWSCVARGISITITTIIRWIFQHLKQHKIVKSHSMIASFDLRLFCCYFSVKFGVICKIKNGLWILLFTNEDFLSRKYKRKLQNLFSLMGLHSSAKIDEFLNSNGCFI